MIKFTIGEFVGLLMVIFLTGFLLACHFKNKQYEELKRSEDNKPIIM